MSGLDDLQADLDALADTFATDVIHSGDFEDCPACDIAIRLRNLLTDRDLDVAPWTSEIIAWIEDDDPDHIVKWWDRDAGEWIASLNNIDAWHIRLTRHGDQRQPGCRLGVREPATERVRLDQLPGRTLPGDSRPVREFWWNSVRGRFEAWVSVVAWQPFTVAPDGTVEVLKDAGK